MNGYFLELYERSGENVKIELDLSVSARKAGLKGSSGIDSSIVTS